MERTTYGSAATSSNGEKWYYMAGGKKCGPVDETALVSMLETGELSQDTRVWTKGMTNWKFASDTELLNRQSNQRPSPVVINMNTAESVPAKKKAKWWIWPIVGVLVIGIVAACYFLFLRKDTSDSPDALVEPGITYGLDNSVIFENDECAFLIDGIGEKGDYLELDVRCVNKTEDVLSFTWNSTCINGSMFDPLWHVYVQGESTIKSSITFPLGTLGSRNLLPADQIKFVLSVYNEDQFDKQLEESAKYIVHDTGMMDEETAKDYKKIDGYEDYLFDKSVKVDSDGRPYYISRDKRKTYFDEIYTANGQPLYDNDSGASNYKSFYNDKFGRPYYFSNFGTTVYYDGYGFAFADQKSGKNYFYDENGRAACYENGGIPEYFEGTVPQEFVDKGKPDRLVKAAGNHVVHKEFSIYPTGKSKNQITYPDRVSANTELAYWNGEKGRFVVLGGEMDEFKGYIVHTYVENNSDSYVYFGWQDVVVNGVSANPDSIAALRPHSSSYKDIVIPTTLLTRNKIKNVEEIDFRVYAVGENLSIPLYPIEWEAVTISGFKK